jgi:hypothetical protein
MIEPTEKLRESWKWMEDGEKHREAYYSGDENFQKTMCLIAGLSKKEAAELLERWENIERRDHNDRDSNDAAQDADD